MGTSSCMVDKKNMTDVKKEIAAELHDGGPPASADQVLAILDRLKIKNSTITHAPMRTVEDSMANKKGVMVLVTLLEDRKVNLAALGAQLNMGKLSFASPQRLMHRLGVIPGAVTPLAVINDKDAVVTAVIDKALLEKDPLHFHPCDNCKTTTISAEGLLHYMRSFHNEPLVVDFDKPELAG